MRKKKPAELPPVPLSPEVEERIAQEYPAQQAEVTRLLLQCRLPPVNFSRMRILEAAQGRTADMAVLVANANDYGKTWTMTNPALSEESLLRKSHAR